MTPEQVATFCLSLPGAREDIKWGGVRVFSLAESKMFALFNLSGRDGLAFKVDHDLFLSFCDRPGIRPAPYLARARWVSMSAPYPLSDSELRELLTRSHQLVVTKLPKRLKLGLLL
ncbi:Predicted DNA-binding protein, MmcQ/YjbR family [Pseudomonas guineae]|uniref:Predicted DNA-binding protein, MmcQ/YjbR family n=1 Tax=Pseudomonas guineae TaxID=425504 RepID=A0A1I3HN92_9PSED|nr:MmcQ/YjbR family DNA-binding protein [Pseudomonas guineae]SFI37194.1 Predicted DNA-binding protein, MmcQ/YjbR family [Pseudomonas guineae]